VYCCKGFVRPAYAFPLASQKEGPSIIASLSLSTRRSFPEIHGFTFMVVILVVLGKNVGLVVKLVRCGESEVDVTEHSFTHGTNGLRTSPNSDLHQKPASTSLQITIISIADAVYDYGPPRDALYPFIHLAFHYHTKDWLLSFTPALYFLTLNPSLLAPCYSYSHCHLLP
jgi:hypothetical protein